MKSPRNLYKIKTVTDRINGRNFLTLAIYVLNHKQNVFRYVYTSGNVSLPEETRKYMYRLSGALFPIPIGEIKGHTAKELFYTSIYPMLRGGGFA